MSNAKTIENLNTALKMELAATHQYQMHAHVLDDWGLVGLAEQMREEQAEELGHSDLFIERILFLQGTPDLTLENPPVMAGSLKEMFEADLKDEEEAIVFYTRAAKEAADESDIGSRHLFERIAMEEEGHKSWLELQLSLLERLGESAFSMRYLETHGDS